MSVRKFVRSKRLLATLSLVTLLGSAGIAGASVANAAAASPGTLMGGGMSCLWPGLPPVASTTVTGSVGDTFTVQFLSMGMFCNTKLIVGSAGVATPSTGTINTTAAVTFTIVGTGSFTLTSLVDQTLTINVVASGGAGNQASTVVASPPPPVPDKMQAVARPSTGCATFVSDAGLNWDGVAGTGWGSSWAQWMNNGLGGDVCMRMLGYNSNTGKTVIR